MGTSFQPAHAGQANSDVTYSCSRPEVKVRIKLSTEMRLLESSAARMLKGFKTDLPAAETSTTQKARKAADVRWLNRA